jgi:hypothetical protein
MSIERHAGKRQIVCECGVSQPRCYARDEFDVMVADAKGDGWAIEKRAGEWVHHCPACLEALRRKPRSLL